MNEWIDAQTGQPCRSGCYIVVIQEDSTQMPDIDMAYYDRKLNKWGRGEEPIETDDDISDVVTHWMPLPPLPGDGITHSLYITNFDSAQVTKIEVETREEND